MTAEHLRDITATGTTATTVDLGAALYRDGFALGTLDDTPLAGITGSAAWRALEAGYEDLPQDTYMNDGGTYRLRRYAEFDCDGSAGTVTLLPHVPYEQSKQINQLNGGMQRLFAPLHDEVADSEVIRGVLGWIATEATKHTGTRRWWAQCFQNRILARADTPGLATPEGVHRDGVDLVLTLMVRRHAVAGGVSGIYRAGDTATPVFEVELDEPGQVLLNDDHSTLHGVSPLIPTSGDGGHRDVFIAILTAR